MYDILSLDSKELDEIKEIAKQLDISRPDKFTKQELIYKILDQQALNPSQELLDKEKKIVKKEFRPRRQRTPMKPRLAASTNLSGEPIFKPIVPESPEKPTVYGRQFKHHENPPPRKLNRNLFLRTEPEIQTEDQHYLPPTIPEPFEFENPAERPIEPGIPEYEKNDDVEMPDHRKSRTG